MGWQDAPPVTDAAPAWMAAPAADQPVPATSGNALSGATRALENNLPLVDRAVAGLKTALPQGYGGTGQDYAANFAAERAKNEQFAKDNYWTNMAGGVAASFPLALATGPSFGLTGLAGRVASAAVPWAIAGGAQGA